VSVELGRLVQHRRHELSLSRRDLAAASGVSYPYVSQIETGDRDPSLKTLRKLAEILELPMESMASLVSPEGWMTSDSAPPAMSATMVSSTPRADSFDLYRDKVLPSVERRLRAVPPLVRLQLLNELIARAVEELQGTER
jgi:transcriptional regulator with XRE-family HTH domain